MSSAFEVPVVKVKLRPHPNADMLSIVDVFGWQVVVRSDEWRDGDLGAFVRPDSIVPERLEWFFLEGKRRIKTRRFRKEWSHGLLIHAPSGSHCGDNVAALLGIVAYEPPERHGGSSPPPRGWWARVIAYLSKPRGPRGVFPFYDVEHLRRWAELIQPGDPVFVTEKIHGANALYTWRKGCFGLGKVFMRSRSVWQTGGWWKKALDATPALVAFLKAHPGVAVFGEVYGSGVQELTYGVPSPRFVAFDIWEKGTWWPLEKSIFRLARFDVPMVPLLDSGGYDPAEALRLANENSELARRHGKTQISEGIVIRRTGTEKIQLKLVSDRYLEKA